MSIISPWPFALSTPRQTSVGVAGVKWGVSRILLETLGYFILGRAETADRLEMFHLHPLTLRMDDPSGERYNPASWQPPHTDKSVSLLVHLLRTF